jgi:hypothetical protein
VGPEKWHNVIELTGVRGDGGWLFFFAYVLSESSQEFRSCFSYSFPFGIIKNEL